MLIVHPKCGKKYPANNTHGHCSRCHETFVGVTAFEELGGEERQVLVDRNAHRLGVAHEGVGS